MSAKTKARQPEAPAPAPASHDILGRIRDREPEMSRANQKIAQAVLGYPRLFVEKPVADLCEWIGVSAPTIIRFCRQVGCRGLRDLKLQVMGAMRVGPRYLEPADPPETLESVREQVLMRAQNAIAEAVRVGDAELGAAIQAILRARTLYAFGSGGVSSWLVEEIQNRFFRLGVPVVPCRDAVMQVMLAASLDPKDVVILCSLGGTGGELLSTAQIAKDYGVTTIALTSGESPLARAVDILIDIAVLKNDGDVLGPTSMRYSYLAVIDLLAFGAAIQSRSRSMEKLRRLKQQFISHVDEDSTRPLCD